MDNNEGHFPEVPQQSNHDDKQPTQQAAGPIYVTTQAAESPKKRRGFFSSIFRSLFVTAFVLSIVANIYMGAILASGLQEREYMPGDSQQKIALIPLDGSIGMRTAEELRSMLQLAGSDMTVKGVILVVNSPGGGVPSSNMANQYIKNFTRETGKPIYSCIQQVGASGAYWIAAATNKIYAQENSLVGSIGVIYMNMVLETTLKDKLGISPVIVKSSRSPFKDTGSPFRLPTEDEIVEIQADIDSIHERFVRVVSQGRGIPIEEAWELANGDVYDGPESKEKSLIDKVGFLEDAIDDMAGELGLIGKPQVVSYTQPPTLRQMLMAKQSRMENPFDIQAQLQKWAASPRILALWPGN